MHGHNDKNIVECSGIALVNKGKIFLIRPLFNGFVQQPGIPKGHIEPGETEKTAALREFKEETGIDLTGKELEFLCHVFAKINDGADKRVSVYKVYGDGDEKFISSNIADNGEPENIDGGYVPFDYAKNIITVYQKPIVEKLIEDYGKTNFKVFVKNFKWFN